jgi:HPt (histidine-containing phosphotransfer) domain-containing protein
MTTSIDQRTEALNAATVLFTEDHSLVEALKALQSGKWTFIPDKAYGSLAPALDTTEHLADLADEAWNVTELCNAAGLTALAGLAKRLDQSIRKVLVDPRTVRDSLAGFSMLTTDARITLDAEEDNQELLQALVDQAMPVGAVA